MNKLIVNMVPAVLVIVLFSACATSARQPAVTAAASSAAAGSFYDQLDPVIEKTFNNLSPRLESGTRIALLPPGSTDKRAADYVFTELYAMFINASYNMADRANIDMALGEIDFGMTGLVSDDTAARIGHLLGAQVIVFGDLPELGVAGRQRLVYRALEVETGRMLGVSSVRF